MSYDKLHTVFTTHTKMLWEKKKNKKSKKFFLYISVKINLIFKMLLILNRKSKVLFII